MAHRRLLANLGVLAVAEIVTKVLTFVAFAYAARVAGPADCGMLEFAATILLFAGLVVDLGLGPYGAREIARTPGDTARIAGEVITARLYLAGVALAAVAVTAVWLSPAPIVTRLLLIYGISLLGMPWLLQWVFQGHDRMAIVAVANLIRQTVFFVVVIVFLRDAARLWIVPAAEIAGVLAAAGYCVVTYRRVFGQPIRPAPRLSATLLRDGGAIGLGQAFWAVKMYGGVILLGYIAGRADNVGYFAVAQKVFIAMHAFVYLYYFNLLPSMSRAWQQGPDEFRRLMDRSRRLVAWLSLCGGALWVLLAPPLTPRVFGGHYAPATVTLQWLGVVCAITAIHGHYRFGLIAAGRQSVEMGIQAAAALVAIVLIPIGYGWMGPAGAAVALLAAETLVWAAGSWYGYRLLGLSGGAALLARPLLGLLATCGALSLLATASAALRTIVTMAILAAVAVLLDADVRQIVSRAPRMLRRPATPSPIQSP